MKTIMSSKKGAFTHHKDMTIHANSTLWDGISRCR
jgi:hypothetical protein